MALDYLFCEGLRHFGRGFGGGEEGGGERVFELGVKCLYFRLAKYTACVYTSES